jgi:Anthrone oxygenase
MPRMTLWLFVVVLGLDLGAGIYEGRIVVPSWARGVPETLADGNAYRQVAIDAGMNFWKYMTSAVGLCALLALLFGLRVPQPERYWRMGATLLEIAVVVWTLAYFRPTLIRLFVAHGADMTAEAVRATVERWVFLARFRVALSGVAWLAALRAAALAS